MNIEAARARRRDAHVARDLLVEQVGPSAQVNAPVARERARTVSVSEEDETLLLTALRDSRISPRIRAEINRLILPLMTLRAEASRQRHDPDSPVAMFVRQLALLGYRDNETPLPEYDMIQAIVTRVILEARDADRCYSGAEALYTLARRAVRRLKEQRAGVEAAELPTQAGAALPRALEARSRVLDELREHAAGMQLPLPAQDFVLRLLGPWMTVRYLRYGARSEPWAEARAFAALFFDALRPAVDEKEQLRKGALRRQALAQARIRTERSRAPVDEAEVLLAWLENHFSRMDKCVGATPAADAAAPDISFLDALPLPASA